MKKFSNSTRSRDIALQFLKAVSTEDVDKILASERAFAAPENWRPYGGQDKNWDRVGGQTSDPMGALAELLINSIDAILMRKFAEAEQNETALLTAV